MGEAHPMSRWLVPVLALAFATPVTARVVEMPRLLLIQESLQVMQKDPVSLSEATQIALQLYPGKVVRAETVARGVRREHQVRILGDDGRVRNVRIDAMSGQIL
jgi:Peptidase propeptide and YPEB domain